MVDLSAIFDTLYSNGDWDGTFASLQEHLLISTESEHGRNEAGRGPAEEQSERGGSVDISV